jgi:eukaryotic-like serine/threonine-protein kinase
MGQVYRATDSNLARTVAIKVLPDAFAQDADRVARFEREARMLAALNHPNIAHIYGLERAQNQIALVMELVEGPTLDERILRGAIPLREALPPGKLPRHWKTPTNLASCIGISSPPTSRFDRTAR